MNGWQWRGSGGSGTLRRHGVEKVVACMGKSQSQRRESLRNFFSCWLASGGPRDEGKKARRCWNCGRVVPCLSMDI